jgi:DNA-binding response OmpR family regulator
MEAVARRADRPNADVAPGPVRISDVEIDLTARRVLSGDREVALTAKESDILAVLAARPGTAVSRQQVMDEVCGDAHLAVSRSLDVHLTQLLAKLARPGLVTTIRGFGYRLGE